MPETNRVCDGKGSGKIARGSDRAPWVCEYLPLFVLSSLIAFCGASETWNQGEEAVAAEKGTELLAAGFGGSGRFNGGGMQRRLKSAEARNAAVDRVGLRAPVADRSGG